MTTEQKLTGLRQYIQRITYMMEKESLSDQELQTLLKLLNYVTDQVKNVSREENQT